MISEKEKMLCGALYNPFDPELSVERDRARLLCKMFNDTTPEEMIQRVNLLAELIPSQGSNIIIEPPFYCDYGSNITLGDNVYFNFNCVILDVGKVTIGSRVLCGPAVQIYAATHHMKSADRKLGLEAGKPVEIGDDTWIGGGAIICPGVRVGARTVIGAGSVVTRDIPDGVFAAGNPCRVIREIED